MQRQNLTGIKIPEQIRAAGAFLGAVYVDFADTECVTAYNSKNLYFFEVVQNNVVKYSSYNVPNIQNLISIIKGYLLITTKEQKLWLFQLRKVQKKQEPPKSVQGKAVPSAEKAETKVEKLLTVESFLKQISFSSYFLREVTPNMIELFVTAYNSDKSQKMLYIYQFTVKQKVGGMGFTIDKNYKIVAHSRKQLYASKSFFDPRIRTLIKLKNFSDNIFTAKKITEQYAYMIPIGKTQEYCYLTKNYELVNAQNPNQRNKVKEELKGYQLKNGIQHLNYLLLRNQEGSSGLFVVEELLKIRQIAEENNQYIWNVCFNGKLVGVHRNGQDIVVTQEYNKKADKLSITKPEEIIVYDNTSKQQKNNSEVIKSPSKLNINPKTEQNVEMSQEKQKPETKQTQKKIEVSVEQQVGKDMKQENKQGVTPNKVKDEPQVSKHKSTFKPAKIVSRKDLKKENKNIDMTESKNIDVADSKSANKKGVEKQEQIVKQAGKQGNVQQEGMTTKNKKSKQQLGNQKGQQGEQNKQKEQKKQQQQLKNEQQYSSSNNINVNINSNSNEKMQQQQVKSIKQQPNSQIQKQNPFLKNKATIATQPDRLKQNNPFNLSNAQSNQTNINFATKDQNAKKDLSPFAKKNVFPTLSYEEIFGARASTGLGVGASLFGLAGKNKQSVQKSPFKKKQEPGVVAQKSKSQIATKVQTNSQNKSNQGTVDASHSIAEKNVKNVESSQNKEQKTKQKQKQKLAEQQQQQQVQNKQEQQQREGDVQRLEKIDKKVQIVEDTQIKDAESVCCVNYDTIKSSYDIFSSKITSLQTQVRQNQQNYSKMAHQISQTMQIAFKNAQSQLIQVSQQKAIKNAGALLENSVNDYLSKKLTPKVNEYFKTIMAETKKIYDHTLKFYVDKKKQTVANLQNHFQEQQHLVSQIRQISADTMAAVQNTVNEGQQAHAYLLKEWNKCTQRLCQRLDNNLDALQAHTHDRSASERQKIIDSVVQLRQTLGAQQQRQRNAKQQAKIVDQTKKKKETKRKAKQEEDEQDLQSQKNKRRKAKKQKQKQLKMYKEQLLRRQMMMRMQPYSMPYHY